jgi:chromosome segregation protein
VKLEKAAHELRDAEMGILTAERDFEALEKEQQQLEEKRQILKAEIETLRRVKEKWEKEKSETLVGYQRYSEQMNHLKGENEQLAGEIQVLKKKVETGNQEISRMKIEEAKNRQQFQGLEAKAEELRRIIRTLDEEIGHDHEKRSASLADLARVKEAATLLQQEIIQLEKEMETQKGRVETLELSLRKERETVRELDMHRQQQMNRFQESKDALSEKNLEMKQVELEKGNIVNQVQMRFDRILKEEDLNDLTEVAVDDEELAELEKKVQSFGEINFVAVQEFEALKERVAFLEKQREDLLVALQTLTETIQRINRTTTARFKETFIQVQKNFSDLFIRLFGGGRGELRLTEPENIKESGIEIFAQPPGKRLQAIRLLSGGEKALVAIAFLFALFLVRPSPFCVLDEVDAPLDDSNIDRFNNLVISLSDASQFILITHNKRTMSEAHTLLGVTMEQPGVSKIVSVEMEKVVK